MIQVKTKNMMKKGIVTAAIALLFSATAFAGGEGTKVERKVDVKEQAAGVYKLVYLADGKVNVKLNIMDQKGEVLHSERIINGKSFSKKYELGRLPAGEYTFEIIDDKGVTVEKVHHSVKASTEATIVKSGAKYEVVVRGEEMAPVFVRISQGSETLYEESIEMPKSFSKVYDLGKFAGRDITFEVVEGSSLIARQSF
jgi:hypothetical protein